MENTNKLSKMISWLMANFFSRITEEDVAVGAVGDVGAMGDVEARELATTMAATL